MYQKNSTWSFGKSMQRLSQTSRGLGTGEELLAKSVTVREKAQLRTLEMSVRGDAGIDIEIGRCLGVALGMKLPAPKAASSPVMKPNSAVKLDSSGDVSNMVSPTSPVPFWALSPMEAGGVDTSSETSCVMTNESHWSACPSASSCESLQSSPSLQCPSKYEGQVGPKHMSLYD